MLATDGRQRLISIGSFATNLIPADRRIALPVAATVGIAVAALTALAFMIMPIGVLEDMAVDSRMAALLAPSDPPLPTPAPQPIVAAPEPIAEPDPNVEPEPQPVITPLSAPRFAPHERIETFGLPTAPGDDDPSAPLPQATLHDLLDRLERVVLRQPAPSEPEPQREKSLEETLDALRALARRVG